MTWLCVCHTWLCVCHTWLCVCHTWLCVCHTWIQSSYVGDVPRAYVSHVGSMSHVWISRVAGMNESCRTCQWVFPIWECPPYQSVTHMRVSPIWECPPYESVTVMSRIWMSHVAHMNESCRTCKWGMSHAHTGLVVSWYSRSHDST